MNLSIIILIVIIITVAVGYFTRINVGLLAMAAAYLFGTFVLNLKTSEIIAFWPTSLFYFILMVSFFYGIAITNGTLTLVAEKAIYIFRNKPWFIPILLWLISFSISGLGPGPVTVFAFMAPIVMFTADKINMSKIIGTIIVVGGGVAGGYTPISLLYALVKTNLVNAGFDSTTIVPYLNTIAFNNIFAQVLLFSIVYIIFKGWTVKAGEDIEKPAEFEKKQKYTLALIMIGLGVMVLFPILVKMIPGSVMVSRINKSLEPSLVSTVLLVVALIFKLGDEKKALNFVPFSTIILVCGVGMLVSVAKAAGAIELFSSWIGSNLSGLSVKIITGFVAGFMSFFSSTIGVVAPTLIPMVPNISTSTGVSITALVSTIMIAGHFAGVSPFSTGGAMTLAGEKDESKRDKLFMKLMVLSLCSIAFAALLTVIGFIR